MTPQQRFAEEYGLELSQVKLLCHYAEMSATADANDQEDSSRFWTTAFENLAKDLGFTGIDYPGLYPTLTKGNKRFINLPD